MSKLKTLIPENVLQEAGINFTAPIFQPTSRTNGTNSIGLSDLKRLNKGMRDTCIDEQDDDSFSRSRDSKGASQRSSDSSISNLSSDIESPVYGNRHWSEWSNDIISNNSTEDRHTKYLLQMQDFLCDWTHAWKNDHWLKHEGVVYVVMKVYVYFLNFKRNLWEYFELVVLSLS